MRRRSLWGRRGAAAFAVLIGLVVGLVGASAPAAVASPTSTCQRMTLTEPMGSGLLDGTAQINAELCLPTGGATTVELLSHGGTYKGVGTGSYWDAPTTLRGSHSYMNEALAAGHAVFVYDEPGAGASSHPLSVTLTVDQQVYVLHMLVGWLRHRGFAKIIEVGHSYGSILSTDELAKFNDADALVVTGIAHGPLAAGGFAKILPGGFWPAATDPKFAGTTLDVGYLTTVPGARTGAFYSPSGDPALEQWDETDAKDMLAAPAMAVAIASIEVLAPLNISDQVRVPVLVVLGEQDTIFCSGPLVVCQYGNQTDMVHDNPTLRANEVPYYAAAPSMRVLSVPKAGHDVTLYNTHDVAQQMEAWENAA